MIKSLYTSISGMSAMQNALSVTSNNIANAQTVGYKKQKAVFDDLLYNNTVGAKGDDTKAGTNPKSIGNGVKFSGTSTDYNGGSITMTGINGQVAIEGNGFFVVGDSQGNGVQYTRKGTFGKSENNYIVNGEGQYVLAYKLDEDGKPDTSHPAGPISIPLGSAIDGEVSSKGSLIGNLSRDNKKIIHDFPVFNKSGDNITMRVQIEQVTELVDPDLPIGADGKPILPKDDKGNPIKPEKVEKPVPGKYKYTVLTRNNSKNEKEFTPIADDKAPGEKKPTLTKTLEFDPITGKLTRTDEAVVRDPVTKEVIKGGQVDIPFGGDTFKLNLSQLTNLPTKDTLDHKDVNGRALTVAMDYKISDNGYVMVTYSDNSTRAVSQLAVATFKNQDGLMKVGNGNYVPTASAGDPFIGVAEQNGAGKIIGGAQEGSNVDLSVEFVDLMLYQRGFQGNAKVIKVSDDVLNEVVNLIR
ncbi:flagellar hook protein FlgE [Bacillus cytotoxicus]